MLLRSTSHVVASVLKKVCLWEFVKMKERKKLMSWRDDSPAWTSSDPEFTSIPAFLCQHQRPNSSTFPSLSGNLNWILIIEEKCPLRYKKLYELLCPAGPPCCYRRFEVTITARNDLWLLVFFAGSEQWEPTDSEVSETGGCWEVRVPCCGPTCGSGWKGGFSYRQW